MILRNQFTYKKKYMIDWVARTGTRPDYLVNRDDQKNEGLFGEKNCTEIKK